MWFLTFSKEICSRDRKISNFDNVCKFQSGNVIYDCLFTMEIV